MPLLKRGGFSLSVSLAAVFCVLLLIFAIPTTSLWADEAFSAFMACQKSLATFQKTLFAGDSSDLQVWLYYLYLFGWVKLAGSTEFAVRSSNIPFIILFVTTLVASALTVFRSRWCWVPAAMSPFLWHYAGEARAYFIMLALSTVCVYAVLAYLNGSLPGWQSRWPWVFLSALFVGTCFHMLMLLAVPPFLVLCAIRYRTSAGRKPDWLLPAIVFAPLFIGLFAFLLWTFLRGTAYVYPQPKLVSMLGVGLDLSGLGLFGPNRKFSIDISRYALPLGLATAALAACLGMLVVSGLRSLNRPLFVALTAASALAILEILALSLGVGLQIDARHCAALLPFGLLWIESALSRIPARRLSVLAGAGLAAVWATADIRGLLLPQYQRQDFKNVVSETRQILHQSGADLMWISDPLGGAYYGVGFRADRPCFPLVPDCATGLASATFKPTMISSFGFYWDQPRIRTWMTRQDSQRHPTLLVFSLDRFNSQSPWRQIVDRRCSFDIRQAHGFSVCLIIPSH